MPVALETICVAAGAAASDDERIVVEGGRASFIQARRIGGRVSLDRLAGGYVNAAIDGASLTNCPAVLRHKS
ncbi:MAG: hypothetical protein IIZ92_21890 [Aquincola sp.]|nr:hypothetical protein [Aquincola sp.]